MKQIGIPHNTEMLPSSWDLVEQYFYEDAGLVYIDTEAVIRHLLKETENIQMIRPSNTRPIRSFKEFLEHGEPEHLCKSHIYVEDLSGNQKRTKMKELERLLKSHDWWYSMSDDGRAWDRGRKQADDIHKLIKDVGDDGKKLYKRYGKKAGVFESKDTGNLYSGYSFFPPSPSRKL